MSCIWTNLGDFCWFYVGVRRLAPGVVDYWKTELFVDDLWHLFIGGKIVAPFEVTIRDSVHNTDSQHIGFF